VCVLVFVLVLTCVVVLRVCMILGQYLRGVDRTETACIVNQKTLLYREFLLATSHDIATWESLALSPAVPYASTYIPPPSPPPSYLPSLPPFSPALSYHTHPTNLQMSEIDSQ